MLNNILLMTDGYKLSHYRQYPKGTNKIYSYLEARAGGEYKEVVFFGLQYFVKRYLAGRVVTQKKIDQADNFCAAYFGDPTIFNRKDWEYILKEYDGKLPVRIKAVLEGTVVPENNVLLVIENTGDERTAWLVNYIETILMSVSWYGCTTATISREMKKVVKAALKRSGTDTEMNLAFKLHDFGYRGVSSPESAAIGGGGHLLNFKGTDTLAACEMLMEYYDSEMPGFSIPAAEHSTVTTWRREGEEDAYRNMLEQFPTGLLAIVSDSWNIRNAVKNLFGKKLREEVLARDGVLIIRPDSGNPSTLLPELLELTGESFGFTVNEKGYKVLNEKVRLIQGDGIKRSTLKGILDAVMDAGWSADNLAFGSGGGLLQDCNRDTQRFALKCSYAEVGGLGRDVFKQPETDPTKNSKRGRLMLAKRDGVFVTLTEGTPGLTDLLVPVFEDGELLINQTLEEIRVRAEIK